MTLPHSTEKWADTWPMPRLARPTQLGNVALEFEPESPCSQSHLYLMVPNIGWAQAAECLTVGSLSKACTASLIWLGRSVLPPSRGLLGETPGEGGEPRWV